MEHISDITEKYKNRPFLQGRKRTSSRLDQYSDDPNVGRGEWQPSGPDMVKHVTFQGFKNALWYEINKRLGVSDDDFKRIMCTNMIHAGVDIAKVMKASGHSTETEFFEFFRTVQSPFITHPDNRGKIERMIEIILSDDDKGIWIEGGTGSGKTMLIDALIAVNNQYVALGCVNVRKIQKTAYYDICLDIEKTQKLDTIDLSIQGSTFIDDFFYLGNAFVNRFGKDVNVAEKIIERAYHQQQRGHKIFMTSNFSMDNIGASDIFPAIMSRLRGMCYSFSWKGKDYRKIK